MWWLCVWVSVCEFAYSFICILWVCVCVYVYICGVCVCVCVSLLIHLFVYYGCVYAYMYIYVVSVCMGVCVRVCEFAYSFICILWVCVFRQEAENLLLDGNLVNGLFLVRQSERSDSDYALSFAHNKKCYHNRYVHCTLSRLTRTFCVSLNSAKNVSYRGLLRKG